MTLRALSLLLLLGLLGATRSGAEISRDLEHAQAELAAGRYENAYKEYLRFAKEKDNPLAAFSLALFHRNGWGRPVDQKKARSWFARAAEQDIPAACHFYGECLEGGLGGPVDLAAAVRWYERAADLGHHGSLCPLASLYMTGRGIERDPGRALELCRKAVARSVPAGHVLLGEFLLEGDKSIRDPGQAFGHFRAAARLNIPEAQYYLGLMLRDGQGCEPNRAAARHWLESAAAQGYLPAYFPTADLYHSAPVDPKTGRLSAEDLAKAYMWLSAASKRTIGPDELARVEKMLVEVRRAMPPAWAEDLDKKVARHLEETSDTGRGGPR